MICNTVITDNVLTRLNKTKSMYSGLMPNSVKVLRLCSLLKHYSAEHTDNATYSPHLLMNRRRQWIDCARRRRRQQLAPAVDNCCSPPQSSQATTPRLLRLLPAMRCQLQTAPTHWHPPQESTTPSQSHHPRSSSSSFITTIIIINCVYLPTQYPNHILNSAPFHAHILSFHNFPSIHVPFLSFYSFPFLSVLLHLILISHKCQSSLWQMTMSADSVVSAESVWRA